METPKGYKSLARELQSALEQASHGKGKERHASNEPFEHQKIFIITRWVQCSPAAALLYQVIKKAAESARMDTDAALRELDGVINYAAAAKILLREQMNIQDDDKYPDVQEKLDSLRVYEQPGNSYSEEFKKAEDEIDQEMADKYIRKIRRRKGGVEW